MTSVRKQADELCKVHERSVDSDFLLLELRELLKKNNALKVVLMSATINQETFLHYFGNAALVTIPGYTFPVKDLYELFFSVRTRLTRSIIVIWRISFPTYLTRQPRSSRCRSKLRNNCALFGKSMNLKVLRQRKLGLLRI
jgi:hypothetical protein